MTLRQAQGEEKPIIVTDNCADARLKFPAAKRIITRTADLVDLPDGTRVTIHRSRIGAMSDDPCVAARAMIDSKIFEEVL